MFAEHFRGASEDLKRPDQIEDLGSRRGNKDDSPSLRLNRLLIIKIRARHRTSLPDWWTGQAVFPFHFVAASRCHLDSSPFILSSIEEERRETGVNRFILACHLSLTTNASPARTHDPLSAVANLSGAASKVFLSSSEQK